MRKLLLAVVVCCMAFVAQAQDPHFSQFFASPLTLNPAFTGKFDGQWRLAVNHRDQWPSIPKAYVTTSGSFDFGIMKDKLPQGDVFGIGISGLSDASADNQLKLNYGSLSMSYHKALDEDGYNTIGLGFQGTYSSLTIDDSKLTFEDMLRQNGFTGARTDFLTNGNNQSYIDFNAGLLFSGSSNGVNNYYAGVSAYHINRPKVGFKDQNYFLANRLTLHAGGTLPITDVLSLSTSIIHQIQNKASETTLGGAISYSLNNNEESPSALNIGSWVRLNDAIIPYIGLEVGGLRIGASYDVNISSLKSATASRGGSEFSLIYVKRKVESKGIPCPKF
ncbi:PorP/SprF family type IX secretion system membrane protein [Ferruginibacter yonginensis]|uniref:PorP/SprF family type IX secretion system membrane protein n=1 Tax=Ferruginibacter yonginensis TaxID=1310416 RepID=A0ABV8QT74_9BACT